MLERTLQAVADLETTVLYATTVLPLDAATLAREVAPADEVVIVEPLYEATLVAQVAAAIAHRPARLLSIGVPRRVIGAYGAAAEHDRQVGLDTAGIRQRVLRFLPSRAGRRVA
jgi:transketolase